jgi:cytochrome c oxidase subunit IV
VAHEHAVKDTIFEKDDVHVVPSTSSTLTTFAVLAVLSLVAIAVGFSDLGPIKVVASLAVAAIQAAVLAVFFMDLRQADKLTWLCAGAAVFWVGLEFLFTLTDYLTRHMAAFPGSD